MGRRFAPVSQALLALALLMQSGVSLAAEPSPPSVSALVAELHACEDERCPAFVSLVARGPSVWPALREGVDSPRELTRFWSLMVLGQVPIPATQPLLLELLAKDPMVRIRAGAAYALGAYKGSEVTRALIGALADPDVNVRLEAASALGRVPDPSAVGPLLKTLHDRDADVRVAVVESLAAIGGGAVLMPIVRRLQRDRVPMVRGMSAIALGNLGSPKGGGYLVERLAEERDPEALAAICWALGELGDASAREALRPFEAYADPKVKAMALEALGKIASAGQAKKKSAGANSHEVAPAQR